MKIVKELFSAGLLLRFSIVIGLFALAVVSGLYLGKKSVPPLPDTLLTPGTSASTPSAKPEGSPTSAETPSSGPEAESPLFLYVGGVSEGKWETILAQTSLAGESGIHQVVVPVSLDWSDTPTNSPDDKSWNSILRNYVEKNRNVKFLLWVNLNPSVSWLEKRPECAILSNGVLQANVSVAAQPWVETAQQLLEKAITEVETGPYKSHVIGYGLTALKDERWIVGNEFDESLNNTNGFREWLRRTYGDDAKLQQTWNISGITIDQVLVPVKPSADPPCVSLVTLPQQQPLVDYYAYCNERVAHVLASFASLVARVSTLHPLILAPYGHSFEVSPPASGQFAVAQLLDSDITGFVSPISYIDRGLGGVGGMMGVIDSALIRGKLWYLIDDTRTGIERNPETGEYIRIKGIRTEDVYEVQRRNFSLAATYGLGLIWSDPQGEGWLNNAEQWTQFVKMKKIYDNLRQLPRPTQGENKDTTLTVVLDEISTRYVQCAEKTHSVLLQKCRDAVLRVGVSARFHLMQDILDTIAPPTPVYLFLNAFSLDDDDIIRLHTKFASEQACAIWLYAPGYFGPTPSVDNISKVTGMDVKMFTEPTETGSSYLLSGQYLDSGQKFGSGEVWYPLFYVEQNEKTDFLAHYTQNEKYGSVAILTLPEGWTSVYIAEPELSPALLTEILRLLEQHVYLNPSEGIFYDTVFARKPLLTIHASKAGKRSLSFGYFCDIEDQLDPAIGWFQKENVLIPLRNGETRLLLQKEIKLGGG